MSPRIAQIESLLKRAVSQVLAAGLSDPRVTGMVSVTKVTVSPDLHDAYVFVSVLPAKNQKRTLYGLRHAAAHIHGKLCKLVDLQSVPHLDFRLDDSIKKQAAVLAAIDRGLAQERTDPNPAAPAGPQREDGPGAARGSDPEAATK